MINMHVCLSLPIFLFVLQFCVFPRTPSFAEVFSGSFNVCPWLFCQYIAMAAFNLSFQTRAILNFEKSLAKL